MPAFEIEAVEEALGQNLDKELEEDFAKNCITNSKMNSMASISPAVRSGLCRLNGRLATRNRARSGPVHVSGMPEA
jgi:hypothetical protein